MDQFNVHNLKEISREAKRLAYLLSDHSSVYHEYKVSSAVYEMVFVLDSSFVGRKTKNDESLLITMLNLKTTALFPVKKTLSHLHASDLLQVPEEDAVMVAYLINEILFQLSY